jgi:hypothetical protein
MKLSESTLTYLKNFSSINSGIVIQSGNTIRTISKQQNILAKAEVVETFDDKIAIYDLNRFLALLSSLQSPEIDIVPDQKCINVLSGQTKAVYRLSDESLVVTAPAKDLKVTGEVKFLLTKDTMNQIAKMAGVLGLPNVCVRGDRSKVTLNAVDVKNQDSDIFSIEVGTTKSEFEMIFSTENFKMIPGDYNVEISSKGISHFKHTKEPIEYWIAIESGSTFTE